jgi:exodeoxyribonuclease V beta subunit
LITAINTIFSHADRPFIYEDIPFQPAVPATKKDSEVLRIHGPATSPLHIWFLEAGKATESRNVIGKMRARELISTAVAAEISRLLSLGRDNKALLGERPLKEGDVAVLVRRNSEARLIQEALSALNIPSVLHSAANLFDSHEALEMERLLAGIAEPGQAQAVRAALATDMMGVKGEDLDALLGDEARWERWLLMFKQYHDLWNEYGFIRMFRFLLFEQTILTRLMSLPHGERRNTNVLHLSEVLHQASVQRKLGITGLLKWLSEQRDPSALRLEEHQLRLETDENAVKVVTIHKSKGLEYPVAFCPFLWDGSRIRKSKDPFAFHNQEDEMRLTLDLGSPGKDENRVFAEKEQLAENLRLLYVALTRARNRCYFVWGRFNEAESSAPAYLFHPPGSWEGNVVDSIEAKFVGLSEEDMLADIETLQAKAGGAIRLCKMPIEKGKTYSPPPGKSVRLACRRFSGDIDRSWRISSFSSLISGRAHRADLADHDVASLPESADEKTLEALKMEEAPAGFFAFPKGAKAGTFLHDIFEHLDFAQNDALPMKRLVAEKLQEYGFESTWQETLCHMIHNVLSVPLEPNRWDFTLSRIQNTDRLTELEFHFPLKSISPGGLKRLFQEHTRHKHLTHLPEQMEQLRFSPIRGFMKGFIDMVFQFEGRFYLVDWKSNFLGSRLEDYDQAGLAAAMEEGFYVLQYHLYVIALNQYLHLRLPGYDYETHFGGSYYIFLRGVDPERGPDFGIYRDRPAAAFINELRAKLIDGT